MLTRATAFEAAPLIKPPPLAVVSDLVQERAAVVNRLQKVLEDANVKLASVVTDVMGVSARAMLAALLAGERDTGVLAELARGRLRSKRAELEAALTGRVRAHHCFLLSQHLMHTDFLEEQIERFEQAIAQQLAAMDRPGVGPVPAAGGEAATAEYAAPPANDEGTRPAAASEGATQLLTYAEALALLDTIPGVNRKVAEVWVAEAGIDMSRFPSERHLAAWTGVAPGNNESAGKRRSSRTRPGNTNLRTTLVQAAHAAAHTQGTCLSALYRRVLVRRGKKRAIVAVAHAIVGSAYYMLLRRVPYQELGSAYLNERQRESQVNRLVHRLRQFGYQAVLEPVAAVSG